jgi:mono/diheme cytochrome c family protein
MRVALALVVVLAASGCGGHGSALGRQIYETKCAACHSLTGHDTQRPGGDLALGTFSVADVEGFAAVMPVRPRLTKSELHAVAVYVRGESNRLRQAR